MRHGGSRREAGGGVETRSALNKGTEVEDRRGAERVRLGHVRGYCESGRTRSGTIIPLTPEQLSVSMISARSQRLHGRKWTSRASSVCLDRRSGLEPSVGE
jgi:hypothetical protein